MPFSNQETNKINVEKYFTDVKESIKTSNSLCSILCVKCIYFNIMCFI